MREGEIQATICTETTAIIKPSNERVRIRGIATSSLATAVVCTFILILR